MSQRLAQLTADITACRTCKRLVRCREAAAKDIPKRFTGETYWARPITGFGDPNARLLVVGLAPAAHGGNRTGRVFTGDRSGDWLYGALHRAGFANQPSSTAVNDGLKLTDAYVSVVVRCAPPGNKPSPKERDACLPFLVRELQALKNVRAILALGAFAWDGVLRAARELGLEAKPRPAFGHAARAELAAKPSATSKSPRAGHGSRTSLTARRPMTGHGPYTLLGSYHVSQQNTFTGRLTEPMLDAVFAAARAAL